jgi:hypothetical protein
MLAEAARPGSRQGRRASALLFGAGRDEEEGYGSQETCSSSEEGDSGVTGEAAEELAAVCC